MRAVLDATAVEAYAAGSIHVGELLAEIADEHVPEDGALVSVPAPALVAAHVAGADLDRLEVLVGLPHVDVTQVIGWRQHATAAVLFGTLDRACAVVHHARGRADYVITCEPDVYGAGVDTVQVWRD